LRHLLHKRAIKLMQEAIQRNENLPLQQATELAWQQTEDLFLGYPSSCKEESR
jgi:hypothetical protein